MWTTGYEDDHGKELNMSDHSTCSKLRLLFPRPVPSIGTFSTVITPPSLPLPHLNFFDPYRHFGPLIEHGKRDYSTQPVVASSRWNPTPEQLSTLEELYRRGTRTPTAHQIQHITSQLRRYGKIEGKNVFYWFQNRKAKERQKRRRQMEYTLSHNLDISETKDSGAGNKTGHEVEQTKNWALRRNCIILTEESMSMQRAAKAGGADCTTHGCNHLDEPELKQRRNFAETNATWQMMQLTCHNPHEQYGVNIFLSLDHQFNSATVGNHENGCSEPDHDQTLQLFPIQSPKSNDLDLDNGGPGSDLSSKLSSVSSVDSDLTRLQFFEFLPLRS